jgi:hypothetical protein
MRGPNPLGDTMQTAFSVPLQADALLAGAILEEYSDLLSQTLQAKGKKQVDDCQTSDTCRQNSGQAGCCDNKPKPKPKKRAISWTDLPRA